MAKATSQISLPVLDLKKAQNSTHRLAVAKQLIEALETVGFLFVDNVEGFDSEKLLNTAQWFFSLNQQEIHKLARKQWNPESNNTYRGYFPTQEDEDSFKEGFEIGQDWTPLKTNIRYPFFIEGNVWPQGVEGAEQFHEDMCQYYTAALKAGTEILRLTSIGWGLEENWFDSMFHPDSLSTLRLLHYPTRSAAVVPEHLKDGKVKVCCSPHNDSGLVTLLAPFHYGGLEIQLEGRDDWLAVPPRPNSLVMNIGEMLATMSRGRFKATRHRVVDLNVDRISVPFFFEPHYDADITRLMPVVSEEISQSETLSQKLGCKTYGLWLVEKLQIYGEYKELLGTFKPQG